MVSPRSPVSGLGPEAPPPLGGRRTVWGSRRLWSVAGRPAGCAEGSGGVSVVAARAAPRRACRARRLPPTLPLGGVVRSVRARCPSGSVPSWLARSPAPPRRPCLLLVSVRFPPRPPPPPPLRGAWRRVAVVVGWVAFGTVGEGGPAVPGTARAGVIGCAVASPAPPLHLGVRAAHRAAPRRVLPPLRLSLSLSSGRRPPPLPAVGFFRHSLPGETTDGDARLSRRVSVSSPPPSETRPQIRRGDPLNLSILVSGGKETNKDSLSNGE